MLETLERFRKENMQQAKVDKFLVRMCIYCSVVDLGWKTKIWKVFWEIL